MKLKTLKDLKIIEVVGYERPMNDEEDNLPTKFLNGSVELYELRQEAIKWIKEHDWIYDAENDKGHDVPKELELTHVDKEFQTICKWIKMFFNITKEDLKEGDINVQKNK